MLESSWMNWVSLTVFPSSVEILHVVIEANPDRSEAQLPLKTRHQAIVQGPGALGPDHGADGSEHAPVTDALHGLLLSLDLGSQSKVNASAAIAEGKKNYAQPCSTNWRCTESLGWLYSHWALQVHVLQTYPLITVHSLQRCHPNLFKNVIIKSHFDNRGLNILCVGFFFFF